jgi:hypothetical protein
MPVKYEFNGASESQRKNLFWSLGLCDDARVLKHEPNIVAQMPDVLSWVKWTNLHKKLYGDVPKFEPLRD